MDAFTYHMPTRIVFGPGTIARAGDELIACGVTHALLVTGSDSIFRNGAYDRIVESLQAKNISYTLFSGILPNPSLQQVEAGIHAAQACNADGVLAVGGGSVLDCAKAIAAGVYLKDYWATVEKRTPVEHALPLVTVVTLSGTGSEMNGKAVITNEALAKKWSLTTPSPKASIIDPLLQTALPWNLTLAGGIDAMTHVMENYFCARLAHGHVDFFHEEATLHLCEGLLRTIIRALDCLQQKPAHEVARANLAWAAGWGLNGLTEAGFAYTDWTAHALEHALSAFYPAIPHGEGLAVLFPPWMEEVCDKEPHIFTRFARAVWQTDSPRQGVAALRGAFMRWGAPTRLAHWHVRRADVPRMVQNAQAYRSLGRLGTLQTGDLERIFNRVL